MLIKHDGVEYIITKVQENKYTVKEVLLDGKVWLFDEGYTLNGVNGILILRSRTHGTVIPTDKLLGD